MLLRTGPSGRVVWGVGLDRFHAEIVGSNPALGMDVCPRLFIISHFPPVLEMEMYKCRFSSLKRNNGVPSEK
jgi:hypothetical protein